MRLINARTLKLEEFFGREAPPYTILSHTWEEGEVTYKDWQDDFDRLARPKRGLRKIRLACEQSLADGFDYIWVDTNCIDKSSSAEMSEAINSMFLWYAEAAICYAYLFDVDDETNQDSFARAKWFTRGWTLQELLAPENVMFFSRDWIPIGSKTQLVQSISVITRIAEPYLIGRSLLSASVAERMSWAADRKTTRQEDIAYCLLGLFDIQMPILYGERKRAFLRLQAEIIKTSTDHTLFAWQLSDEDLTDLPEGWINFLARSPSAFRSSGSYYSAPVVGSGDSYAISNIGLTMVLPILWTVEDSVSAIAVLNCGVRLENCSTAVVGIPVDRVGVDTDRARFRRSMRWRSPILVFLPSLPLANAWMYGSFPTQVNLGLLTEVDMVRLSQREYAQIPRNLLFASTEASGIRSPLFLMFNDSWKLRGIHVLEKTTSPVRGSVFLSHVQVEPLIVVSFDIGLDREDVVVVEQFWITLGGVAGPEVARLEEPVTLGSLASGARASMAGSVSWGAFTIELTIIGQGEEMMPAVAAHFIRRADTWPQQELVRGAVPIVT